MLELYYVKLTNMGNYKLMHFDFYGDLTKPKQILWGFLDAKNQNSLANNFPTGNCCDF